MKKNQIQTARGMACDNENVNRKLMNNRFLQLSAAALACIAMLFSVQEAYAGSGRDGKSFSYKWKRTQINASRTGVSCPSAENAAEALGTVSGRTYIAPSGTTFRRGSVPEVARLVIGAQPVMAPVKKVVGHSPEAMKVEYPESALSNLFADKMMEAVEKVSGRHVDVGIVNFGGIRVDMPEGDILVDDIMSMFPFKNNIVYVALKGSRLKEILDGMAARNFQALGGIRVVAEDGKIVSAEVGGEPIEDDRVYGLATITFLLHGGDDLFLGEGVEEVTEYPVDIYDAMMDWITSETAAGRDITYRKDGRVVIR